MNYREYQHQLNPHWLREGQGGQLNYGLGSAKDEFVFLAYYSLTRGLYQGEESRESLFLLARERGLTISPNEAIESVRDRVLKAWEHWIWAGTVKGVTLALEAAGYKVKSIIEHTYATDNVNYAEFTVTVGPGEDLSKITDRWNDGSGTWGDGTAWGWVLGAPEPAKILAILRDVKAAHSVVRNVYYELGDPVDLWGSAGTWGDGSLWYGFDTVTIL